MSTSVSNSTAKPRKRKSKLRIWVSVLGGLFAIVIVGIVVRTQGRVSGVEFTPTHFQQREFSFYEIPILHLQITPIKRRSSTPATALYLRQNSLVKIAKGPPTDDSWHVVSVSRGLAGQRPIDAKLLVDQLEAQPQSDPFWEKWSIDNPEHAKVLWPVIQKLAQRELYVLIPKVFELARQDSQPDELAERIDEYLRQEYSQLITDMRDANRDELADGLVAEILADFPDDPELAKLRQSSSAAADSDGDSGVDREDAASTGR